MSLALSGVVVDLIIEETASATLNTVSPGVKFLNHNFYIQALGTVSGGQISISEAINEAYTGVWSLITTVDAADASSAGDGTLVVHIQSYVRAFKVEIIDTITGGGNISVRYAGT